MAGLSLLLRARHTNKKPCMQSRLKALVSRNNSAVFLSLSLRSVVTSMCLFFFGDAHFFAKHYSSIAQPAPRERDFWLDDGVEPTTGQDIPRQPARKLPALAGSLADVLHDLLLGMLCSLETNLVLCPAKLRAAAST